MPLSPPDVVGVGGWVLELKNQQMAQYAKLGDFVDQMAMEKSVSGGRYGAVMSKRHGRPIEDAYVVMRLEDWAALVRESEGNQVES